MSGVIVLDSLKEPKRRYPFDSIEKRGECCMLNPIHPITVEISRPNEVIEMRVAYFTCKNAAVVILNEE